MNKLILNIKVQYYIKNYKGDISKLAFSGSPFEGITKQELIGQIESRRKIEKKLPTWYKSDAIYYPPKLNLEQTSSEVTAKYKSSLVKGKMMADITGGFGVDTYYFLEKFESIHHFEINKSLSEITKHNFSQLGKLNIQCFAEDGMNQLNKSKYDLIYLDPSRRHSTKGKVFFLKDCKPNIPENLSALLNSCNTLLFKTSPMLDITSGINELACVYEIHIVAIDNEVKELLWLLKKDFNGAPQIKTINISKGTSETFDFHLNTLSKAHFGEPEQYLYEPNAAIMKSGAFDLLSQVYKVNKLHQNSQLYTNSEFINFPGRRFLINQMIQYNKADIRAKLATNKANITVRNFPEDVATLRKKLKIKDGGDQYLFFTTLENNKKVILQCTKID